MLGGSRIPVLLEYFVVEQWVCPLPSSSHLELFNFSTCYLLNTVSC